jgi:hypothetical protein
MSETVFSKCECRHCAGHLEFPAEAAGETIPCPHCGQPTELVAPVSSGKTSGSRRRQLVIVVAVLVVLAGLVTAFFLFKKNGHTAIPETASASQTNSLAAAPASQTLPADEERTNDFTISAITLEKTPGSSLVHVTGKVQNLTGRQRFGVKIGFALFDVNNKSVGLATDYQAVIEPNSDWEFKALVMESKTASARFSSISEDK